MQLIERPQTIDLSQSHRERRVFFVGKYWWDSINRAEWTGFGYRRFKEHGLWRFVYLEGVDPSMIVEIPALSRWWAKKQLALPAPENNLLEHKDAESDSSVGE